MSVRAQATLSMGRVQTVCGSGALFVAVVAILIGAVAKFDPWLFLYLPEPAGFFAWAFTQKIHGDSEMPAEVLDVWKKDL